MSLKLYMVTVDGKYLHEKWDVYDSFIVCCESKEEAIRTHPSLGPTTVFNEEEMCWVQTNGIKVGLETAGRYMLAGWIYGKDIREALTVQFIGRASKKVEKGVVLASFNAG